MTLHVVIASRSGLNPKSRCAGALNPVSRRNLTAAMLSDMLVAIRAAAGVDGVWVATPSPELAVVVKAAGARVIHQRRAAGLNAAFRSSITKISNADPQAQFILLPGDLPLLQPTDIEAVARLCSTHEVVLAPSLDGGTGALGLHAGTLFDPAFGFHSEQAHREQARQGGLDLAVIQAPSLALDVDRPEDFPAIIRFGPMTRCAAVLQGFSTPEPASSVAAAINQGQADRRG